MAGDNFVLNAGNLLWFLHSISFSCDKPLKFHEDVASSVIIPDENDIVPSWDYVEERDSERRFDIVDDFLYGELQYFPEDKQDFLSHCVDYVLGECFGETKKLFLI